MPDDLLGALGRLPLLEPAEAADLARAAEAGALAGAALASGSGPGSRAELEDVAREGEEALRLLIVANIRLVAWAARRRVAAGGCPLTYAELTQEGLPGLVRAAHKWDYRRGIRFSTYALPWIRAFQQRAERHARGLSIATAEQQDTIRRARAELTTELARTPTADEVAQRVGLSAARIATIEGRVGWGPGEAVSLDADISSASSQRASTRHEVISDPRAGDLADTVAAAEERSLLYERISQLPARYRKVLEMHFGLDGGAPHDLPKIARECRVSTQRAADTLARALDALRAQMVPQRTQA